MTFPSSGATGAVASGRRPPGWLRAWRVPVLLVVMFVVMAAAQELTVVLGGTSVLDLVVGVAAGAGTLWLYVWLSKFVEQRSTVTELPRDRAVSGLLFGSAIGAVAFLVTILVVLIFGGLHVTGGDPVKFVATIGIMACAAVTEEVLFRGIIFRITEERFGIWVALVVSSVLFGLLHLAGASQVSGGAEIWGAVAIILQGGALMGVAYMATRSLWVPIGVHFAWNLVESGFGTAVSGKTSEFGSLVNTVLVGPSALTGGSFGPEAGVAAIGTCLAVSVLLLVWAARRGRLGRRGETEISRAGTD